MCGPISEPERAGTGRKYRRERSAARHERRVLLDDLVLGKRIQAEQAQRDPILQEDRRPGNRQSGSGHVQALLVRVVVDDDVDRIRDFKRVDEHARQVAGAEERDRPAAAMRAQELPHFVTMPGKAAAEGEPALSLTIQCGREQPWPTVARSAKVVGAATAADPANVRMSIRLSDRDERVLE